MPSACGVRPPYALFFLVTKSEAFLAEISLCLENQGFFAAQHEKKKSVKMRAFCAFLYHAETKPLFMRVLEALSVRDFYPL